MAVDETVGDIDGVIDTLLLWVALDVSVDDAVEVGVAEDVDDAVKLLKGEGGDRHTETVSCLGI